MAIQPVDYVLLGLSVLLTALGLFRGFSGAFAFLVATSLGAATVVSGWSGFLSGVNPIWARAFAAILVFVVVFGAARYLIKLIVGKVLSQPSDSIFGVCLGLFCGGFMIWALANEPQLRGYSFLAQEAHALLR